MLILKIILLFSIIFIGNYLECLERENGKIFWAYILCVGLFFTFIQHQIIENSVTRQSEIVNRSFRGGCNQGNRSDFIPPKNSGPKDPIPHNPGSKPKYQELNPKVGDRITMGSTDKGGPGDYKPDYTIDDNSDPFENKLKDLNQFNVDRKLLLKNI